MSEKPISDLRRRMLEDMAAQIRREDPPRLYPPRRGPRQLPRPLARHGNGRRRASLSHSAVALLRPGLPSDHCYKGK